HIPNIQARRRDRIPPYSGNGSCLCLNIPCLGVLDDVTDYIGICECGRAANEWTARDTQSWINGSGGDNARLTSRAVIADEIGRCAGVSDAVRIQDGTIAG